MAQLEHVVTEDKAFVLAPRLQNSFFFLSFPFLFSKHVFVYVVSHQAKTARKVEEDAGIQGNWTTGMVEVQLPVKYKLKNIDETEKAKQKLLEVRRRLSFDCVWS